MIDLPKSLAVYTSVHTAFHNTGLPPVDDNIEYYTNEDVFLKSKHNFKIAIVEADYSSDAYVITDRQLEKFKNCNHVIVYSMEGDTNLISLIKKYDLPNFIFVVNCWLNFKLVYAQTTHIIPHMKRIFQLWMYEFLHLITDNLTPFQTKPYHFEVMYGAPRTHRLYVANWINNNDISQYCFQTPFFNGHSTDLSEINLTYNLDNSTYWEDDVVPSTTNNYYCEFRGVKMSLSQVMPFKIYQQTAYSLVCETTTNNNGSFFTEKIAKPLLASRLFIVISGQYYLKNLRNLGFKTFDGIIDESYDLESDPETRWNMAMEQVKWLCQQDQSAILESIKPIVQHNRNLIDQLRLDVVDLDVALTNCLESIAVNH